MKIIITKDMETKILEEFGLTKGESQVYLALLELGESSVGEIAKKTNLQRSAIYFSLNRLIESGLVSYIIKNNIKYFKASSPKRFKEILEEKKKKVDEILPQLESLEKIHKKETKATIFEGYNGLRAVLNHRIDILKPGDTIFVFGARTVSLYEKYRLLFHNNELKRVKKRIKFKIICNTEVKDFILKYYRFKLRENRFLDIKTPSGIAIYGDYVSIFLFNKEPIVFQIKDKKVADSYKEYFKIMWKIAKK